MRYNAMRLRPDAMRWDAMRLRSDARVLGPLLCAAEAPLSRWHIDSTLGDGDAEKQNQLLSAKRPHAARLYRNQYLRRTYLNGTLAGTYWSRSRDHGQKLRPGLLIQLRVGCTASDLHTGEINGNRSDGVLIDAATAPFCQPPACQPSPAGLARGITATG